MTTVRRISLSFPCLLCYHMCCYAITRDWTLWLHSTENCDKRESGLIQRRRMTFLSSLRTILWGVLTLLVALVQQNLLAVWCGEYTMAPNVQTHVNFRSNRIWNLWSERKQENRMNTAKWWHNTSPRWILPGEYRADTEVTPARNQTCHVRLSLHLRPTPEHAWRRPHFKLTHYPCFHQTPTTYSIFVSYIFV